mmetsp:Transcript_71715/g.134130  ORF Transcript_71715/g.134130 Transcript_71715/m.134130 type:complete len:303 (+) Transcript_71715:53-961(+)
MLLRVILPLPVYILAIAYAAATVSGTHVEPEPARPTQRKVRKESAFHRVHVTPGGALEASDKQELFEASFDVEKSEGHEDGDYDFIAKKIAIRTGVNFRRAREIFAPKSNLELGDLKHLFGTQSNSTLLPILWGGLNRPGFRLSMCEDIRAGIAGLGYLISDTPAGSILFSSQNPIPPYEVLQTASRMQVELIAGLKFPSIGVIINRVKEVDLNNLLLTQVQAPALLFQLNGIQDNPWTPNITIYNQVSLDETDRDAESVPCAALLTHATLAALKEKIDSAFSCVDCGMLPAKDCLRQQLQP